MPLRFLQHLRQNAIAYFALFLAVGAGGGYAIAATRSQTITVCVDKRTGVMHLHHGGKCGRAQTKLSWNQQGVQGLRGATGTPGTSAPRIWAIVAANGSIGGGQGRGVSAQHTGTGTYLIAVTDPACAQAFNAPTVSVTDSNPPNGQGPGTFPAAWVGDMGPTGKFTVYTGVVAGGSFTASDRAFNLTDGCS